MPQAETFLLEMRNSGYRMQIFLYETSGTKARDQQEPKLQ
jgi:hypothetical protein